MAKKVRRVRKPRRQSIERELPESGPMTTASNGKQNSADRFQQEYAYVLKDLRHILILAVAMFILLVVLNVILPHLV
jgi:hypothetical protein